MKFTLLLSIYLLTFYHSFCQTNKIDDLSVMKTDKIILGFADVKQPINKNISQFIVIDARPDSTSFGFYKVLGKNYSLTPESNAANDISYFLKDYLQPENGSNSVNIVMVLKKLWLTNELLEDAVESAHKKNAKGTWKKGVIAKIEFYYGSLGSYVPLYRFDTSLIGSKYINDNAKEYIRDILIMSVQKLISADLTKISPTRKKMSLPDIIAYSRQQLNIPISSTGSYKKGVYKTFDEFKMNEPSITNFEIRNDKLNDMIFIKDGNVEYPVRDVWGFSDGDHLYIQSADNYFKLLKKQNTFICSSAKDLTRKRYVKIGSVLMFGVSGTVGMENKRVDYSITLRPYELDMETGGIY